MRTALALVVAALVPLGAAADAVSDIALYAGADRAETNLRGSGHGPFVVQCRWHSASPTVSRAVKVACRVWR